MSVHVDISPLHTDVCIHVSLSLFFRLFFHTHVLVLYQCLCFFVFICVLFNARKSFFIFFSAIELIEKGPYAHWRIRKMLDITMIYCAFNVSFMCKSVFFFSSIISCSATKNKRTIYLASQCVCVSVCVRASVCVSWVRNIPNKCRRYTFYKRRTQSLFLCNKKTQTHSEENVEPKRVYIMKSVEVNPFALFKMDEDEWKWG